jgi:hypothetical protein
MNENKNIWKPCNLAINTKSEHETLKEIIITKIASYKKDMTIFRHTLLMDKLKNLEGFLASLITHEQTNRDDD